MNAGGTAQFTGTVPDSLERQIQQLPDFFKCFTGQSNTSGIAVIDKNRSLGKLFMKRMGNTPDIVPVAENQQGEYGYRSMFQGMDTTHEVILLMLNVLLHLLGNFKP